MISPQHKTLFVHIPKVAGQSIETVFLEDLGLSWDDRGQLLMRKKQKHEKGPYRLAHLRARDYVALGYLDEVTFNDFFKFSFVRDPYARTLSLYHYLGYSRIISISCFLDKVVRKKVEEGHFFFMPQYDYLYDPSGKLLVDFVGKLEQISEDAQTVFNKARLQGKQLPHINKSEKGLKRGLAALVKNPSLFGCLRFGKLFSKRKTRELNDLDKECVYKLYSKDFESFNYEK